MAPTVGADESVHGSVPPRAGIPTEFWLWWITNEFGERRMTTYRMSRQVALDRYPDARRMPGTGRDLRLPTPATKGRFRFRSEPQAVECIPCRWARFHFLVSVEGYCHRSAGWAAAPWMLRKCPNSGHASPPLPPIPEVQCSPRARFATLASRTHCADLGGRPRWRSLGGRFHALLSPMPSKRPPTGKSVAPPENLHLAARSASSASTGTTCVCRSRTSAIGSTVRSKTTAGRRNPGISLAW